MMTNQGDGSGHVARRWTGACLLLVLVLLAACTATSAGGSTARAVGFTLHDFRIAAPATSVPSGSVDLQIHNAAPATHEFLVFRTDLPPDRLPIGPDGLSVDEDALHKVDELSDVPAGSTRLLTLQLPPGRYVVICNLEGHYLGGMHASLVVRPEAGGG